ncbi:MFS transporter [Zavarzinia sp. CC-PAN008]|uniref:MFS transporter n=1 Tax=Zavarzinia sp. CC-PAN008 TaxID=3243332 RepID=UPI003F746041
MSQSSLLHILAAPRRALRMLTRAPIALTPRETRVFWIVGLAFLANEYDQTIYSMAIAQVQRELLIGDDAIGGLTGLIRLGVIPAALLAMGGDLAGRRRLLMLTILGLTLATAATAFAQTPAQFALCQAIARAFATAEELLSIVVIAEEMRPEVRGWALGALAALGAMGSGVASIMFGLVDLLPFGWRALYLLGALPLLGIAWARRGLPETERFARVGAAPSPLAPLLQLARQYPRRVGLLVALIAPMSFAMAPTLFFMAKYLQTDQGYSPANVATVFFLGGSIAFLGNLVAGRLADRVGRRPILIVGVLLMSAAYALFYQASGAAVIAAWIVGLFSYYAAYVVVTALSAELFPTSARGTASGLRGLAAAGFQAAGLFASSALLPWAGSQANAIAWLLLVPPLTALIAWLLLPETARRDLDETAQPDGRPPAARN